MQPPRPSRHSKKGAEIVFLDADDLLSTVRSFLMCGGPLHLQPSDRVSFATSGQQALQEAIHPDHQSIEDAETSFFSEFTPAALATTFRIDRTVGIHS